ncbi:Threonylcarbamoyl-AMP synthase [uncultured archaeon]|nr:Threonylcarbamoyl-AMP synthase [uncultured archaeon]
MIASAARFVIGGGVIVYPTETVYGLGANALDEQAVMRVYQIKKRPLSQPIFLAISSFEMLNNVADVSEEDMDLLKKLLPWPISVLVRRKSLVPDILTAGSPFVGIRYPDHETALRIIDSAGPITSTSANRTGSPSPTSIVEVSREIADRVDAVVDGGKCRYSESSTLLDLERREIIRKGAGLERVLKAIS